MSKRPVEMKPVAGYYVVVYGEGYIWPETMGSRAKDCRRRMGEIMVRIRRASTVEEGWRYAFRSGYRVRKVDVLPHGGSS